MPRRGRGNQPSGNAGSAAPRYRQVAEELTRRIGTGRYPVGGYLPTEMELCEHYGISRHTVREALRRLRDAGLIWRRRRVGTQVVARTPPASYRQPTNSIADLLQYADETQLTILQRRRVVCDAALAQLLDSRTGEPWIRLSSLRAGPDDERPICLTIAYVDATLPAIEDHLAHLSGPISAMLERVYDLAIARVDQSIQAVRLGKRQATLLRAGVGSPALQAIRRYYDKRGRLIELSNAVHPGDRFTYVTSLVRQGAGI